jgi:hypothetical protein
VKLFLIKATKCKQRSILTSISIHNTKSLELNYLPKSNRGKKRSGKQANECLIVNYKSTTSNKKPFSNKNKTISGGKMGF